MKKMLIDGNEAVSNIAYLFTELSSIYPITPSSSMAENVEVLASINKKNIFGNIVKIVEMQSEAGAIGTLHGALSSGLLATTFTASQGLLLMIPNMYKLAGEMLPAVIHVSARSLSTHALSILGDHQDIYSTRSTGFLMLASSSVEETSDMALIAHLTAIDTSLPIMHFFDGFRTSHEINEVNMLTEEEIIPLIDMDKINDFKNKSLLSTSYTVGTNQNDDIYFQATEARNKFYDNVPNVVKKYMDKINDIKGTNYKPFEYYGSNTAENIIIAMCSVTETIKETIDVLNSNGYNVGLITVHLYRPFSIEYLKSVLPKTIKNIAVLDKTKEHGSIGEPLYLDVNSALGKDYNIYGGIFGISGKNTNPACIKAIYDFLNNKPFHNFTVGITDDVTNRSISVDYNFKIDTAEEFLIYGYGSDGMISASKSFLHLMKNDNNYVQGYFQYDSKKSGGVTTSHLRISNKRIRSTYYVENPKYVIISRDSYLEEFSCFEHIKENGIVLINTDKSNEELNKLFNKKDIDLLISRNAKVYVIRAYELARRLGLKEKTSMIMEAAMINLATNIDKDKSLSDLINHIYNKFSKKGKDIVDKNIEAINLAKEYMSLFNLNSDVEEILDISDNDNKIYNYLANRKGNELKTSDFIDNSNGKFYHVQNNNKRAITTVVPNWISSNCINCNQCSFVCPHSVIRPFLLSKEEFDKAPDFIKDKAKIPLGKELDGYYYILSISINNCTGCGLCIKTCPAIKKALTEVKIGEAKKNREQEVFDYLVKNITDKNVSDKYTVKGSQFRSPEFEFCGACSGCGETAYIKLLTQLFKEQLVIANATGCSSIYGGDITNLPYKISWASSLFEDNAEFGYGMALAEDIRKKNFIKTVEKYKDTYPLLNEWLDVSDDIDKSKEVYDKLKTMKLPDELDSIKDNFLSKSVWAIGGDGWAYDIGFSGIDHVLSTRDNINILVLDTEVYSNTGGQSSKSSRSGSIAAFTSAGKDNFKKDLAGVALMYPNVYVAQVSLGGNMGQVIKVMKEAANYNGPSIIIAYAPCISHGLIGGMRESINSQKMAVTSGYFPIFNRNPETGILTLDFKNVDFNKYDDFLNSQMRYRMLQTVNSKRSAELLKQNKQEAIIRFNYYKELSQKDMN